jgi:predicted restriction endonuclease
MKQREASRRAVKPQRRVWDSPQWRTARKAALRRDSRRCRYTTDERFQPSDPDRCNAPATSVHHVRPVADGGRYDTVDLLSLCATHHGMLDGRRARR